MGKNAALFQVLIGILQRRIELDKEVLFQFNTIKHEAGLVDPAEKNPTIAPTLMKFQRGCHQVKNYCKVNRLNYKINELFVPKGLKTKELSPLFTLKTGTMNWQEI